MIKIKRIVSVFIILATLSISVTGQCGQSLARPLQRSLVPNFVRFNLQAREIKPGMLRIQLQAQPLREILREERIPSRLDWEGDAETRSQKLAESLRENQSLFTPSQPNDLANPSQTQIDVPEEFQKQTVIAVQGPTFKDILLNDSISPKIRLDQFKFHQGWETRKQAALQAFAQQGSAANTVFTFDGENGYRATLQATDSGVKMLTEKEPGLKIVNKFPGKAGSNGEKPDVLVALVNNPQVLQELQQSDYIIIEQAPVTSRDGGTEQARGPPLEEMLRLIILINDTNPDDLHPPASDGAAFRDEASQRPASQQGNVSDSPGMNNIDPSAATYSSSSSFTIEGDIGIFFEMPSEGNLELFKPAPNLTQTETNLPRLIDSEHGCIPADISIPETAIGRYFLYNRRCRDRNNDGTCDDENTRYALHD